MSVLIRGMDMPENCCQCEWHECYGGDYDWCHACHMTGTMPIENAETGRAEDCPIVEIPSKHGRLIDGDAVIANRFKNPISYNAFKNLIERQMTVIKAEEET